MRVEITNFARCLLAALCCTPVFVGSAGAEFQCTAQISYIVTMKGAEKETTVEHSVAKASGASEDSAKAALDRPLRELKLQARADCKEKHENLSGCVGAKFESMASVLQRLPFTSRKSVEEAISQDCQAQMGVCGEVKAETNCVEQTQEDTKKPGEGSKADSAGH